ncbi:magnesium transporter MRS2-1-like [Pistacia vera]|uniref:magnesium transporter MRS2-1-like n=1 Tax=Pistacia vera TaxID=55513 RepID=UPI001263C422|nr:magnesium transporter MRS2-1-like [Pistacia vera]
MASSNSTPPTPGDDDDGEPLSVPPRQKVLGTKSWLVVSELGESRNEKVGKYWIMRWTGPPARDLRVLDPMLSYPSTSLGRERAIVVNLEHIKAIITAKEVFLLNSINPLVVEFVQDLQHRISSLHGTPTRQMGRGGKVTSRGDVKRRVRSKGKGSDDSDEDYVVLDEGNDVSEDELEDYCPSIDGCASEENFGGFVEEEEEVEEEKEVRKRKRVLYGDEEDEDYEGEQEEEDEEFTLDEDDCLDDEKELVVTKKKNNSRKNKKLGRKGLRKKGYVRGRKRRKCTASAKPLGKKGRRTRGLRRKERCGDDEDEDEDCEFLDDALIVKEKSKTKSSRQRRKYVVPSDSNFVSFGSSDFDYTISEEEREQVREANELCGYLKTSLRSSVSSKR